MSVFESLKHLTLWAGLTPTNNTSAGKKKSVKIFHAGQYLKTVLIQLTCIYYVIKSGEYFNPIDYKKLTNPKSNFQKVDLTVETALQFLTSKSIEVSALTSTI